MQPLRHELIGLSERARWSAALEDVPHGYAHTWGFCRAVHLTSGLPTYLYRYQGDGTRVVCTLSERTYGQEVDVVTPFGFGGFATSEAGSGFAADWAEFARSRGWVCGYHALDPLLHDGAGFPREEVHVHNQLYLLDLDASEQALFGRLSQNRRRQLRDWPTARAQLITDRAELKRFFVSNYPDFARRKGAGPLATETLDALAELDDLVMVGAGRKGAIEAVGLFGHTPHGAHYLFNVSRPGGERHAAHLVWFAVEQLRALGVARLNLGGGVTPGDSVAEFKRRFGARILPLRSLRQVYRPAVYARLCRRSRRSAADRAGYFPPYRAGQ